jgi:hypothetical protein
MGTLLSLFDYTGAWAEPYLGNGWTVFQLDIKLGTDIMEIDTMWLYENVFDNSPDGTVDGIIAAPPCTDFSRSGAQYWPEKDRNGDTDKSAELVRQVLRIVDVCMPDFWAIENPVGRLNRVVPELQPYGPWYFQPYDFGDPFTKKTGLWGEFNLPRKSYGFGLFQGIEDDDILGVNPEKYSSQGSPIQRYGGQSKMRKEARSITPSGFAFAFYEANH